MQPTRSYTLLFSAACLLFVRPMVAANLFQRERLDHVRMPFVENCGQFDDRVAFAAPTLFGSAFVTRDGAIVYALPPRALADASAGTAFGDEGWSVRETLAAPAPQPFAGLPSSARANYFHGDRPERWQERVATYDEVRLGDAWPGVSVVLRAHGGNVEKVFVLQPGSRVRNIRIRVEGADRLRVDGEGGLLAETGDASIRFTPPFAYQESGGERHRVPAAYVLRGREYGFRLGRHDPALPVVIDPLVQSTYLGGSDLDSISAIVVHPSSGEVLVMGGTLSVDFPGTQGGARPTFGGTVDSYVARFDPTLTRLLQVTYFGGSDQEGIGALAVDPSSGDVLIGGFTQSTDLPGAAGGAQPARIGTEGEDGYVARLDASLTRLIQATYFGGTGEDFVTALAVDPSNGEVLIAGNTFSTDLLGTAGAAQPSIASSPDPYVGVQGDGFVARLSPSLRSIVRTTYVGGLGVDRIFSIAVQPSSGDVLVAGDSSSSDFPNTAGGAQPEANTIAYEGFVARFDAALTTLRQATYFGGTSYNGVLAIAVEPATEDVFAAGFTTSTDLPGTSGGAQHSNGGGDADGFVARFDSTLTTLRQATYLGGSGGDFLYALALHPNGDVYVAGETGSANFPGTAGGAQATYVGTPHPLAYASDVFVARLDASLRTILQSTFVGGTGEEDARAIALDPSTNSVYVAGETSSTDFPTAAGGAQPAYVGGGGGTFFPGFEGFVTRLSADLSSGSCRPTATTLCLNGNRFSVAVAWQVPDQGRSGVGMSVPLTGDTGMFWFFDPANVELVVKVLDGTPVNGNYWVFYAGLSDVAYTLTVTDLRTGQVRKYENPRGTTASAADISAFAASPSARAVRFEPESSAPVPTRTQAYALYELRSETKRLAAEPINPCAPGGSSLCLLGGRFQVAVDWEIPVQGRSGHGIAAPITTDTGSFWFFNDGNVELAVKVLDGRALNGHFWLFVGGLTDVQYTLRVTDTESGTTRSWSNTEGQLASWADTAAF